jgi:hypothetical protein
MIAAESCHESHVARATSQHGQRQMNPISDFINMYFQSSGLTPETKPQP